MQRYFIDEYSKTAVLNLNDSHHINNVMRNKLGDIIEVVASNKTYLAEIIALDKNVTINLYKELSENKELLDITLVQALVSDQKMTYIIQKATELGVKKIIPFAASRSIVKLKEAKKDRWSKIAKEASEQSKRQSIPEIGDILSLADLCQEAANLKILCTVNEKNNSIKKVLNKMNKDDRIIIVIGPEGGFSKEEEEVLIASGFIATSLGELVLRTETASSYVLSAINYQVME